MGGRLDRAALGAACAAGYYLFFLNAWGSIPLACASAFAACVLTGRLLRDWLREGRASRSQARAALWRVAAMEDGDAEVLLRDLIRRRYPGETFRLTPVLKHPEATLSSGDILSAWKVNRDAGRLVIAATCPCEPRAAQYARELLDPVVAVLDSRALVRLLRGQPAEAEPPIPRLPLRVRLRRVVARVSSARVSPKNLALAAFLLAAYLLTGNGYSLFASLAILVPSAVALAQRRMGKKRLFET